MSERINIIGSGVGGLSLAIRLAVKGHKVRVFEKNSYPGGKLSELILGQYRFDKGPSLFTLPELVDELTELAGNSRNSFKYRRLDNICNYFYEDGTRLRAYSDLEKFSEELNHKLGEEKINVKKHLNKSAVYYKTVKGIFLESSLYRIKNIFRVSTLLGLLRTPTLNLLSSMDRINRKRFKNQKTVQLFNRYATYNGSDPYRAPALLNLIPHLEYNLGAYLPEKGMYQITEHLVSLAEKRGVEFCFGSNVERVLIENNKVKGLKVDGTIQPCDIVVSDMDIHAFYKNLLPENHSPEKLLKQEKSSSAFVFYWGIGKEFPELDLHNILFSNNYKKEFEDLFNSDKPFEDPTVYINISSKLCPNDAPKGKENWFVMVNVPHNRTGEKITYANELREQVINKIDRMLGISIRDWIEEEAVLDPYEIERQTSSYGGSLYGNSSNSRFSAFLRHANYSNKIKGLYFTGGSVHPGGGIPLCLMSSKIVSELIL